jgi:acyl dehydratase
MSWGEITDEGLAEVEELIGVPLRRSRMQWIETTTKDAIKHFAWGIGDDNPLWLDPNYAVASSVGSLIAPPCILYALDSTIIAPKLPGVQWIYAGTDFVWFDHIKVNTSFDISAELLSQQIKKGRRFPRWVLQSGKVKYHDRNKNLIATAIGHVARTPRHQAKIGKDDSNSQQRIHRYSPEEIADIEDQILSEKRRGDTPLFWENVNIGDEIPSVVKGPLTTTDILAWYAASQGALHYGGAHGDVVRYRQRHADYHLNKDTGAKDSAGRGHLEVGTGNDVGMGGAYDIGPQRIAWAQHMLSNWIGDDGFLHKLSVSVRQPNLIGDTIWWSGIVKSKEETNGLYNVKISLTATNQRQETSAFGSATVLLPSKKGHKVPLPLSPSSDCQN